MTSIMPLQNPQRRNNELTSRKTNRRLLPSGVVNMFERAELMVGIGSDLTWSGYGNR